MHGVLANLKRECSSRAVGGGGGGVGGSNSSSDGDRDGVDGQNAKKRRRKKDGRCETRQKKKERKDKKKKKNDITSSDKGSGSDNGTNNGGLRLPQNKVQAGHARKMREAKDIRNKSAEDMAAIFGVKADFYQKPREWTTGEEVGLGNNEGRDISGSVSLIKILRG